MEIRKRSNLWRTVFGCIAIMLLQLNSGFANADGTEELGTPSIAIGSGTGIIVSGVGLAESQPGSIDFNIPEGADIVQVLLYWEGYQAPPGGLGDDNIIVDGNPVTGMLIGGPLSFENNIGASTAYRADITPLNLVVTGANSLPIEGLGFTLTSHGAGLLVIINDNVSDLAEIDLRDGNDFAYGLFSTEVQMTTEPQTFMFAPSPDPRIANLELMFASVSGTASSDGAGIFRPTAIEVSVDGGPPTVFNNLLDSIDGQEWDSISVDVPVPALATSVTVEALSVDNLAPIPDDTTRGNVASFNWISAGLAITPPPSAALGDRVWEDLDADGIQDCEDTNQNKIIGDAGDVGDECDAGIPDVPVNLLAGNCVDSIGQQATTDMDGFYLFENLEPGDYCVEFGKPPVDFCDTRGFDLGEPEFTAQNAGNDDAVDSDADTTTGVTDPVNLSSGGTDLTVDAGIICPAKIGDRVWSDDNENGTQDGEDGVEGVKVTLFECGDDMAAGTSDDVDTGQMRVTGTDGMYMFGAEPDFTLDPGKYFVQFMKPDGTEFTTPKVGSDDSIDSDCLPPNGISSCVTLGSRGINLDRDCGIVPPPPPECDLELDKTCRVETPPVSGDLECEAKIAATELEYTGSGTPGVVTVEGKNKKATVASNFDPNTGILTIDARPEDLGAKMTITTDGVAEVIHTSCSIPYVVGLPAPLDNSNGGPSANWLVLSFIDKHGASGSVPGDGNGDGDGVFTQSCIITQPSLVTYRYDVTNNGDALSNVLVTDDPLGAIGGPINMVKGQTETFFETARISETTVNTGMAVGKLSDGSNCPASDTTTVTVEEPPVVAGECEGKVTNLTLKNLGDGAQVTVVQKKDGDTVFDGFVPAGGEFSFTGTWKKGTLGTEIRIFVNGNLNTKIHTSCSQPIGPGLISGSFEVISGDSRNGGPLPPI